MAFGNNSVNLAHAQARAFLDELAYGATAYQVGTYANAALGATWVDLTSASFLSMGDADPVLGPVACDAGLDFLEVTVMNRSANSVYFVLRAHFVAPGPIPEDPLLTAHEVPAGATVTKACSLANSGAVVDTIAIIAGAPASSVAIFADFAQR